MVTQSVEALRYRSEGCGFDSPMVSLEFFIDIILPAALWPWVWLSLYQKWVPGIFPGSEGGRCIGLTTLPASSSDCFEIWEPQPPGTLRACPGLQWDCFTFFIYPIELSKASRYHYFCIFAPLFLFLQQSYVYCLLLDSIENVLNVKSRTVCTCRRIQVEWGIQNACEKREMHTEL